MNKLEKLFRKISKKDREALRGIIGELLKGELPAHAKKLEGGDFYRIRKRQFRIIFHYTKSGEMKIDLIRLRDEKTYKDL